MSLEDSLILDVEVGPEDPSDSKIRIKFIAVAGGCGPELVLERGLAITLFERLRAYLEEGGVGNETNIEGRDRPGNASGQER